MLNTEFDMKCDLSTDFIFDISKILLEFFRL
jgi:hypothetical protein